MIHILIVEDDSGLNQFIGNLVLEANILYKSLRNFIREMVPLDYE